MHCGCGWQRRRPAAGDPLRKQGGLDGGHGEALRRARHAHLRLPLLYLDVLQRGSVAPSIQAGARATDPLACIPERGLVACSGAPEQLLQPRAGRANATMRRHGHSNQAPPPAAAPTPCSTLGRGVRAAVAWARPGSARWFQSGPAVMRGGSAPVRGVDGVCAGGPVRCAPRDPAEKWASRQLLSGMVLGGLLDPAPLSSRVPLSRRPGSREVDRKASWWVGTRKVQWPQPSALIGGQE